MNIKDLPQGSYKVVTPTPPTSGSGVVNIKDLPQGSYKIVGASEPKTAPEGKKGLAGFGLGALKGAGSTASNLGEMGQSVLDQTLGRVENLITGKGFTKPQNNTEIESKLKESVKPKGTAEKIGFGAEQVGEFLIPGGQALKASKALEGAEVLSKLPKLGQGAAKLLARAGTEALSTAGVTAAQGGSKRDIKNAALMGGVGGILAKGVSSVLKDAPASAWSQILKRTSTQVAKNPNLPDQAAKTGLFGFTKGGILGKAANEIQQIEVALDDLLTGSTEKIGTLKIAPYLDELRNAYKKIPGEQASVKAINEVSRDLLKKKSLTPLEANELKRAIYKNISSSYGKGLLDVGAKTDAQKAIARGLKSEIEKIIPEAKSLNEKQAIYLQVKKAIERQMNLGEGRGIAGTGVGLYDLLTGGIGTGLGSAVGSPLLGIGLVGLKKTVESPSFLSGNAKLINYFNELSPTKKALFYNALKGLVTKPTSSSGE